MKKILIAILLGLMIISLSAGLASAQKDIVTIKGEVIAIEGESLTVATHQGTSYVFTPPDGFDLSSIQVGDSVLVKAHTEEDGAWLVESIKQVGKGSNGGKDDAEEDEVDGGKPEGIRDNSAFCTEGKQEEPHPLAPKIAERFSVTEDLIMGYYCDGFSLGAIMLAIKTSQLEDISVDVDTILTDRASGKSWGQIWLELGLIGSEKNGHSPPGHYKRPAHAGSKGKE